jgi:hypothetical protein
MNTYRHGGKRIPLSALSPPPPREVGERRPLGERLKLPDEVQKDVNLLRPLAA